MTRIKISIGILSVFVGLSIFSCLWVNSQCSKMLSEISAISETLSQDKTEQAVFLAENLDEHWEDFRKKASVILKNDRLTEIDRISSGIAYKIMDSPEDIRSELIEFRHMLELLKVSETPTLTSIL